MARPLNVILPLRTGSSPKIVLNIVDLPAPFGPITVVNRTAADARGCAVENRHFPIAGEDLIENEKRIRRVHVSTFSVQDRPR